MDEHKQPYGSLWGEIPHRLKPHLFSGFLPKVIYSYHFTRGVCLPFFKRGVTDALHWTPLFKENIVLGPHSL